MRTIIFVCVLCSTCYGQSQKRSDFYGVKLRVINRPDLERDMKRSWVKYYPNPTDEDSRYLLSILEELETRRVHLNTVFRLSYEKDSDLPAFVLNRIRYEIPDRGFEVPHTYELLEHIESYLFYHLDIEEWKKEKEKIRSVWEYEDWIRRLDFVSELKDKGVAVSLVYEYYEYYLHDNQEVQLDGLETTFESLGYIEIPPEYPLKPKKKGPVFGFDLWQK